MSACPECGVERPNHRASCPEWRWEPCRCVYPDKCSCVDKAKYEAFATHIHTLTALRECEEGR